MQFKENQKENMNGILGWYLPLVSVSAPPFSSQKKNYFPFKSEKKKKRNQLAFLFSSSPTTKDRNSFLSFSPLKIAGPPSPPLDKTTPISLFYYPSRQLKKPKKKKTLFH